MSLLADYDITAIEEEHMQAPKEYGWDMSAPLTRPSDSSPIVPSGTSDLIAAAEKYAEKYDGDDRQDIKTDILNAFYQGAKWNQIL